MKYNSHSFITPDGEIFCKTHISGSLKFEGFVQYYNIDPGPLDNLSGLESKVLNICIVAADWYTDKSLSQPGNKFIVDSNFKNLLLVRTDVKLNSLFPTLRLLVKKNLLIKNGNTRGIYYLNPQYIFKGTLKSRMMLTKKSLNDLLSSDNSETFV